MVIVGTASPPFKKPIYDARFCHVGTDSVPDANERTSLDRLKGGMPAGCPIKPVSRPGLFRLIARRDKPASRRFDRWINHEVPPSIMDTCAYAMPGAKPAHATPQSSMIDRQSAMIEALIAQIAALTAHIGTLLVLTASRGASPIITPVFPPPAEA